MDIKIYNDAKGKQPFVIWLENIKDYPTRLRIRKRIRRMEQGNLGDYKLLGDGVFEARMHFGKGYRIYFGKEGEEIILLLIGGDKQTQNADIHLAKFYWYDYKKN